jgi:serine/threonine protein kinase
MSDAYPSESVSALPPGTRLGEFEVKSLLGVGGFGIVYLAFDHALEREVAIKEYMPASMAGRTETLHVSLRSQGDAEIFALGLRSFVNEAKLLARFDHPSLIKVHRFWEANGTAYMAMPVLRGRTLKDIRRSTGRAPDETWIRDLLVPLLGALELLHNEGVYHRDIAPDNIHLEGDGRPVLLDFGAARRVITGKTQTLTAILKPAYAPIEQYAETGAVKQGPWTDLYALGATLHFMLLGVPPAPATARTISDESSALAAQGLPGCTPPFLAIIDWMLAPRPNERPQSVAALRAVLDGRAPLPAGAFEHADVELDGGQPAPQRTTPPRRGNDDVTRAMRPLHAMHAVDTSPMAADAGHRMPPPAPPRSKALPLVLGGLLLAGVAGYVGWTQFAPKAARDAAALPASAAAAALAVSAPAAVAGSATAPAPAPVLTPAMTTAPAANTSSAVPSPPTPAAATGSGVTSASDATTAGAAPAASGGLAGMRPRVDRAPAAATPPRVTPGGTAAGPSVGTSPRDSAPAPPAAATAGGGTTPSHPPPTNSQAQASPGGNATAPTGAAVTQVPPSPRVGASSAQGRAAVPPSAASGPEPGPGATPESQCSGRNPLSYFVCMERECFRSRFKNHPECQTWRQQARPREGN